MPIRTCGNGGNSWSYSWSSRNGVTTYRGNVPAHIKRQIEGQKLTPKLGEDSASKKAIKTSDYYGYGLELHNWYRKRHGSPKLVLSDRLNKAAVAYAYKLACKRQLVHTSGLDYGENLYMSVGKSLSKRDHVKAACQAWYDEIKMYNFSQGGFSMRTGHFTAMVWKSSTQLGIGVAEVAGYVVVVANYKVLPNMQGQFRSNVLPYREVEDSESEKEEEEESSSDEMTPVKDGTMETKVQSEENEISPEASKVFNEAADDQKTIGWEELRDLLNKNVEVGFGFEIDKTICKLMISVATFRTGEKKRINLSEFGDVLKSFEGFLNAYTEFDVDCSGLLDPFEFKSAMQEAGFDISWKTFKSLQKIFPSEDGSMDFRSYVCSFLLFTKLHVVQEKRNANMTRSFEAFSLREWIEDEMEVASK